MQTGDGFLARLTPGGDTIALNAFERLCIAARAHGNGIIEVTSRGNIQVRGLSAASTPAFAAAVEPLGIDHSGVQVLTPPLAALDSDGEIPALAAALRVAIAQAPFAPFLAGKLSIVVDGNSALHLDGIVADIRLRATDDATGFHVAVAGDAAAAHALGAVRPERAVECVVRLLDALTAKAPNRRMREALRDDGTQPFRAATADLLNKFEPPKVRPSASAIGVHRLRGERVAVGLGLPFGHADADTFRRLVIAARDTGAAGLRTAPERVLLVVGLAPDAAPAFIAEASALGFVTDAKDPRRRIVACAGAPICASGQIPARALAPLIAQSVGNVAGPGVIHVSGCAKGCAHPAPAPLTVVGRAGACDVLVDGTLLESVSVNDVPALLARLTSSLRNDHG
jgi:precorrin-3B synthase